jgi:hypothetical protein
MHKDFSIWLVKWSRIITNISRREICFVREVSSTVLIELINQTDVAIWTAVRRLFVQTVVVNVWVATLSLVAKDYGKKKTKL